MVKVIFMIKKRINAIIRENGNEIDESKLRTKLLEQGYTPCHVSAELKELKEEYADIIVYPVMRVIDYHIQKIECGRDE